MDEDLVDYAVERMRALGASYAEARIEHTTREGLLLKNGNPDAALTFHEEGMGMRALVNGGMAFASLDNLKREEVGAQAERCVRLARAAGRRARRWIELCEESAHVHSYTVEQKEKLSAVPQEEKFALLFEVDRAATQDLPVPGRYLYMETLETEKYYANSESSKIRSVIPRLYVQCMPTVVTNGQSAQARLLYAAAAGWEWLEAAMLPERMAREVRVLYESLTKSQSPPKEKVDLVVGPEVAGIAAHESCGHPYEADRILGREAAQAGESFVRPKMLGERIGSEHVTIIDDPTLPHSYGFYLYDDEGVSARPRHLMLEGRINELLHNRETARTLGMKRSNGSSRCSSYNREPIVRMANTFVKLGDHSFEELIEEIALGVYIKSFNEWNIDDIRYNQKYVGREAYLIEKGEVKGMVKNPTIELTTPGFWSAVDAVGNDLDFSIGTCGKGEPAQGVPVSMGGPHLRLRGIRLGG
ncbi:MAG: TldD/PmbA family protein [Candidatus Thermoplasmatota archaeon]